MKYEVKGKKSRLKEHRRKVLIFKLVIAAIFLVSMTAVTAWIFRATRLDLEHVVVTGNASVPAAEIESVTQAVLGGSYLAIFPKSSFLLYPKRELEAALLNSIPSLDNATVSTRGAATLTVSVSERRPFALYCPNGLESAGCFFVDRQGLLFAKAPAVSGSVYLRFSGGSTTPALGERIFPESFSALNFFTAGLAPLGFKPAAVAKTPEGDFMVTLEDGARLLISPTEDMNDALSNFKALFSETLVKKFGSDPLSKVDYIDLRFGNRLYYKLKE